MVPPYGVPPRVEEWFLYQNQRLRAVELRQVFMRLGPTFVKVGQSLSTRPNLCPPSYLEELFELQVPFTLNQRILTCVWIEFFASMFGIFIAVIVMERDALPTFPDEEAFTCIERELELPLDSVYSSISASPIAAASLGQVYKA
ncbi:unnamed protein product [Fraxinus pennsylvanica]|uniref:ABC1 atypical kinase-like domain-containing protein n=1 Tax=Fraxinus pennsylvanica TaxID=56036 RepID=A0AAD2EAL9_9LAMI|nr:unnamed protein product [Fraxinus pennsylvanica]